MLRNRTVTKIKKSITKKIPLNDGSITIKEKNEPTFFPSNPNKNVSSPVYNQGKSLAYVAHRMPGIYACTYRVFHEVF